MAGTGASHVSHLQGTQPKPAIPAGLLLTRARVTSPKANSFHHKHLKTGEASCLQKHERVSMTPATIPLLM